jgi:alanyl-tRNA synthetase
MSNKNYSYIIADHIRAASFMIADGVEPSGKQRGYVLRKIIRRSLSASLKLKIDITNENYYKELVQTVVNSYNNVYTEITENQEKILQIIITESKKYHKAIKIGEKEWAKILKTNQN